MSDLWRWRLRRAAIVACGTLVAVAVPMVLSVQLSVTNGGATELLDGRADTSALLVPAALFLLGASGLLVALAWRPGSGRLPD